MPLSVGSTRWALPARRGFKIEQLRTALPAWVETIANTTYTSNTGDPVHRFYQMRQQSDCSIANINPQKPERLQKRPYAWVAIRVGWGLTNPPMTKQDTFQGGVPVGYETWLRVISPIFWIWQRTTR